jgi:6-bladed beta-propeller
MPRVLQDARSGRAGSLEHGLFGPSPPGAALALGLLVAACAGGETSSTWRGTIDTLPNGAVVVRNEGGQVWDSTTAWRLVEDLRIGTAAEGPQSFSTIAGLEVDGGGRIYVIDRQAQEVRVFDSTGAFVRRIGRPGRGPGEFVGANGLAWGPRGRLWVVDQQGERYTLFDTTGRLVEDHPRQLLFYAWTWRGAADTAGRLHEDYSKRGTSGPVNVLLRFNGAFTSADTFPLPRYDVRTYFEFSKGASRMFTSIPYAPALHWRVDRRGYLWFGVSDAYRIVQRGLEGDTVRIIERAVAPVAVKNEEEDSAVARIVEQVGPETTVDRSRIPDVKPAFDEFWLDDGGRVYVLAAIPQGAQRRVLDVFDARGRYLGRVTVPFAFLSYQPVVIRRDRFYTVTEGADGVPYVVRATIVRGQPPTAQ